MRRILGIVGLCSIMWTHSSWALALPGAPSGGFGDEVRSFDGTTCKNGNTGPMLDLGMAHENSTIASTIDSDTADSALYARIVVPLGRSKSVDCNQLYQMELERLRLELEMLKEERDERINRSSIYIR